MHVGQYIFYLFELFFSSISGAVFTFFFCFQATGVTAQLPSESTLDEQFATYLQTTTQLEAASGSIADDGLGSHSVAVDTSATDTSMPVAGSG